MADSINTINVGGIDKEVEDTVARNSGSSAASRCTALESRLSNLSARVDEIIAPSGEAPSAAEVADARIGYDNTIYKTLGDAIRTQVSDLNGEIGQVSGAITNYSHETGYTLPVSIIEQGSIDATTGKKIASDARIRTSKLIPAVAGMTIKFTAGTVITHYCTRYYDMNGNRVGQGGFGTVDREIPDDVNICFVMLAFRSGDGSTNIIPSQYDATVTITTDVNDALGRAFYTHSRSLTDSDDLDLLEKPGIYYIDSPSPAHTPEGVTKGRLLVVKSLTESNHSLEWQMLSTINGTYIRAYNSTLVKFNDWVRLATSVDLDDAIKYALFDLGTLTNADDFNNVEKTGIYTYPSGSIPQNAPPHIPTARVLVIKSRTANNHTRSWQITAQPKGIFVRSRSLDGTDYTPWLKVATDADTYHNSWPVVQDEGLPYNALLYHAKWDSLLETDTLRRVSLGLVDNDQNLPMYAYEFSPQRNWLLYGNGQQHYSWDNPLYTRPKILLLGGAHGNEKCTPMDIYTIAKRLKSKELSRIACKFDWYFIPLLNPWGYSHARLDANGNILYDNSGETAQVVDCSATINAGIRFNSHGMDINRDWSDVVYVYSRDNLNYGFQTPELQLIKDYVIGIKPDIVIDAHQNHMGRSTSVYESLLCYLILASDSDNVDPEYRKQINKIYRQCDIANSDVDRIMKNYSGLKDVISQSCINSTNTGSATAINYFAGTPLTYDGHDIGNTLHQDIATVYSLSTETSEICAPFSGTTDWYTEVPCTFSTTYLYNIIKQISENF